MSPRFISDEEWESGATAAPSPKFISDEEWDKDRSKKLVKKESKVYTEDDIQTPVAAQRYIPGGERPDNPLVEDFQSLKALGTDLISAGKAMAQTTVGGASLIGRQLFNRNRPLTESEQMAVDAGKMLYDTWKNPTPEKIIPLEGMTQEDIRKHPGVAAMDIAGKTSAVVGPMGKAGMLGTPVGHPTPSLPMKRLMKQPADNEFSALVNNSMDKGIRPKVAKRSTYQLSEKARVEAQGAVKTIIDNKDILNLTDDAGNAVSGLPTTTRQFSQAIGQLKNKIYEKYSAMSSSAGGKGLRIDTKPIAEVYRKYTTDEVWDTFGEGAANNAAKIAEKLGAPGKTMTPQQLESALTMLNDQIKGHLANPSGNSNSIIRIHSEAAAKIRSVLDDAITKYEGPGYRELRRQYGELRSIEKEVADRVTVGARASNKGLVDIVGDTLAVAEISYALMKMSPEHAAVAAGIKIGKKLIKDANDHNKIVANMFDKADKMNWSGKGSRKIRVTPDEQLFPKLSNPREEAISEGLSRALSRDFPQEGTNYQSLGPRRTVEDTTALGIPREGMAAKGDSRVSAAARMRSTQEGTSRLTPESTGWKRVEQATGMPREALLANAAGNEKYMAALEKAVRGVATEGELDLLMRDKPYPGKRLMRKK